MKQIYLLIVLFSFSSYASVIGVSTHPLNRQARVLSAEMTGYMSQRHEMGMGLRYTQELKNQALLDLSAAGAQESRGLIVGSGLDFKILSEDVYQPRVSVKPYYQYQKFDDRRMNLVGAAPTLRKGFSTQGVEFFPYMALPTGIKIDSDNDEFVYYSALSMGMSMPWPTDDKFILSLEANRDFGASSDYIGALVSWAWK